MIGVLVCGNAWDPYLVGLALAFWMVGGQNASWMQQTRLFIKRSRITTDMWNALRKLWKESKLEEKLGDAPDFSRIHLPWLTINREVPSIYSFCLTPTKRSKKGPMLMFFQGGTSMCSSLLWQLSKSHDNSRDEGHVLLCWLSEWRPCIHLLFLWGKALKLKEWCCNMLQQMILPSAPRSSNVHFVLLRFMVGTHPTIHVDRVRPW